MLEFSIFMELAYKSREISDGGHYLLEKFILKLNKTFLDPEGNIGIGMKMLANLKENST